MPATSPAARGRVAHGTPARSQAPIVRAPAKTTSPKLRPGAAGYRRQSAAEPVHRWEAAVVGASARQSRAAVKRAVYRARLGLATAGVLRVRLAYRLSVRGATAGAVTA